MINWKHTFEVKDLLSGVDLAPEAVQALGREGKYDEMPDCYKKIDEVMAAQSDLVSPTFRLTPLMVVKG